MTKITENEIELFAIELFEKLGYNYIYAPELERNHEEILLKDRLLNAVEKINPSLPQSAIEDAIKQIVRIKSSELLSDNETFHKLLVEGVKVDVQRDGITRGEIVHLVDFDDVKNQWVAHRDAINNIITERTGLKSEVVKDMMDKTTFMTANQAIANNFCTALQEGTKALSSSVRNAMPKEVMNTVPEVLDCSDLHLRALQLRANALR